MLTECSRSSYRCKGSHGNVANGISSNSGDDSGGSNGAVALPETAKMQVDAARAAIRVEFIGLLALTLEVDGRQNIYGMVLLGAVEVQVAMVEEARVVATEAAATAAEATKV